MLAKLTVIVATLLLSASPAAGAIPLPEELQGRWSENLLNCGDEDTTGMFVRPQSVHFYEADGTLKSVRIRNNGTIAARLVYLGEGRTWKETSRFMILNDRSSVLVRALGRSFTLFRCA